MEGKLTFLGTGGSMGVPVIGCSCAVCTSKEQKNIRLRPSLLVEVEGKSFLIDAGPDFREQALKHRIDHLDGLLLTHAHFDHIAGIDELRIYYLMTGKKLPCLLSSETYEELKKRYHYLMRPVDDGGSLAAQLSFKIVERDYGSLEFESLPIRYMSYEQGGMKVTGYRFGGCAYISDIRDYTDEIFTSLEGVKTLVISAPRYTPSPVHFGVDEAIAFSEKVGAQRTYLMHISHDLDHAKTNSRLPAHVQLAYDGQEVYFG